MEMANFSKRFVRKKVLIPVIIGIGVLLSATFIVASPIENSWAQQLGMNKTAIMDASQDGDIPKINGSVNVREGIKNFFTENAKIPFITAAQTAQDQVDNGTVLGGHIGVTQGYLTYTYLVMNPINDTAYKVVIDAGNDQVLYTSETKHMGSLDESIFGPFGHGLGRGPAGFGPFGHGFGPFGHGFGPFGHGFGPFGGTGGGLGS
jgi:uncharacterized membrane protein YkoI